MDFKAKFNPDSSNAVREAIETNSIDNLKFLIKMGSVVNAKTLHSAMKNECSPEIIQLLLKHGADVNAKDVSYDYYTPLHFCAEQGNLELAQVLLEYGADPNLKDIYGDTPLAVAFDEDDIKAVIFFLNHGSDPNAKNIHGRTPIYVSRFKPENIEEIIQIIQDYGIDVKTKTNSKSSLLHSAAEAPGASTIIFEFLLSCGLDINVQSETLVTPLHCASTLENNVENIKFLLDRGANINSQDIDLETPLYKALFEGHESNVEFLLDAGADTNCIFNFNNNLIERSENKIEVLHCLYMFIKHLILLKMLNLLDEETYLFWKTSIIAQSNGLQCFEMVCEVEAHEMRNELICPNRTITFADILSKNLHKIAVYLSVNEIQEQLDRVDLNTKFPHYSKILKKKINEGTYVAGLLNEVYKSLQLIFGIRLPFTILPQILNYLNKRDLEQLSRV